jgi:hypothetical protein
MVLQRQIVDLLDREFSHAINLQYPAQAVL